VEYVLNDTNILDPKLAEKFDAIISNDRSLQQDKVYRFTASFHVDLLKDLTEFERFSIPDSDKLDRKKDTEKDAMYDVLRYQLNQLEQVLNNQHIKFYSSTIQGEQLDSVQNILINVEEDNSQPTLNKKGKTIEPTKVRSIVPSKPYTTNLVSTLAGERLNELYNKFFGVIRNKKIIAEILGINETNDDSLLFQAFVSEYGELWLTTSERRRVLVDRLSDRVMSVLDKYIEKDKS